MNLLFSVWPVAFPAVISAFVNKLSSTPSPLSLSSPRGTIVSHHVHSEQSSPRFASAETNDTIDLAPHYTSQSTLDWLRKMADSYELERGEDLLGVIAREGSDADGHAKNDDDAAISGNDVCSDPATSNPLQLAVACARTNLPIASHDFLRDPLDAIYNYGNLAFLEGFGYEWEEFVRLPSRKCVETEEEVGERQRLLDAVKTNAITLDDGNGSVGVDDEMDDEGGEGDLASNYDNLIRVRKDGQRILLKGVNLWNVYDIRLEEDGESLDSVRARIERGEIKVIGQAVWIRHVDYLN